MTTTERIPMLTIQVEYLPEFRDWWVIAERKGDTIISTGGGSLYDALDEFKSRLMDHLMLQEMSDGRVR